MDVFYAYTYSTAGWLTLQSIPLLTVPEMMTTMLSEETRPPSSVEVYFARCLGFNLFTLAILVVILTGSVPLTSSVVEPVTTDDSDPKAPYAVPTLIVTTTSSGLSAFYAYSRWASSDQVAFAIGMVGYSLLAALGLWCILFASSNGKISRKTGADKRTAGFPFKNQEAAKKHAWKKSS